MRWELLFDDLEHTAEALQLLERDSDIAERTRAELQTVAWTDRCVGAQVALRVKTLGVLRGTVDTVTPTWLLLHADRGSDWVVATDAVLGVVGAPREAGPQPHAALAARMTWVNVWSILSRDRARVHVVRRDGGDVDGVAARVGKDFVELWCTDPADPEHAGRTEIVPYVAVVAVRCPR